jgi:putative membrane protein
MDTTSLFEWKYIVASLLYSGIGIIVFAVAFALLDLFTPKVHVWAELVEKQNLAMGIFLGAVALGISIIIASAIHG